MVVEVFLSVVYGKFNLFIRQKISNLIFINQNSGNMDYVCKENNKCIIDVSRRNQCQSCRLKKCLEVKMNKDGNLNKKKAFILYANNFFLLHS